MPSLSDSLQERLNQIVQPHIPSDTPSALSSGEEKAMEDAKAKYYTKTQKAHLKNFKQDMRMRREYADRIYNMLAFWLVFTGGILFMVALGKLALSENVIIALLTTSSANVIAIFIYVVKYLYAKPGQLNDEK